MRFTPSRAFAFHDICYKIVIGERMKIAAATSPPVGEEEKS